MYSKQVGKVRKSCFIWIESYRILREGFSYNLFLFKIKYSRECNFLSTEEEEVINGGYRPRKNRLYCRDVTGY